MTKPKDLTPEELSLMPNGIENVVLYCCVCREPLPIKRRTVGDHAGACHKVRVLFRKYKIAQTKCISCLHPTTPEERADFKRWRKSRGDIRERGGRAKGQKNRIAPNSATSEEMPLDNPAEISQGSTV